MALSTVKLTIKFLSISILQNAGCFVHLSILVYDITQLDKLFQKCKIPTRIQNIKTNLTVTVDTWLFVINIKFTTDQGNIYMIR